MAIAESRMTEIRAISNEELVKLTAKDEILNKVTTAMKTGIWPTDGSLEAYKRCSAELSLVNGFLLRGFRIVPPQAAYERLLNMAHEGHTGIVRMKSIIRQNLWWPGCDRAVEDMCKTSLPCKIVSPTNLPEPMRRSMMPTGPWQKIAADLMSPLPSGETPLVVICYQIHYPEVEITTDTSTSRTIKAFKDMFTRWGNPRMIRMDNGPRFASEEMKQFLRGENIQAEYTLPYWPRANGLVERMNKSLKTAIQKAMCEGRDWHDALVEFLKTYRATPHQTTGRAPCELMLKRRMKGKLPMAEDFLEPEIDPDLLDRDAAQKE